jgi:aldehyde:ferredoxin oxidoreductase
MVIYMFGYTGKILEIDLTTHSWRDDEIEKSILSRFLGGRGLGAYLLWRAMTPKSDPLGPDNKLIFTTGPLTGTPFPTGTRAVTLAKSPLTGIYLYSMAGTRIGLSLKRAGYDALMIGGRAETPSFLQIMDTNVEINAIPEMWGVKTSQAFKHFRATISPSAAMVGIGPAGENLVRFSALIGDDHRRFGRGGLGAIMGSKNLKAIAVDGSEKTKIVEPDGFRSWLKKVQVLVAEKAGPRDGFSKYGTGDGPPTLSSLGILPTRNWQSATFSGADKISMPTMREKLGMVKNDVGCQGCPIRCGSLTIVKDGSYAGAKAHGPEYETMYALGSNCGIDKPDFLVAANELCDEEGLDTMSAGLVLSFAMECFEKGVLTAKDNEGQELRFGDDQAAYMMLQKISKRQGLGDLLAEGVRIAASKIGGDAENFAMHVKGMELGGYDPRGAVSQVITYAAGSRGGCHHAIGLGARADAPNPTRHATEGKAALIKRLGRKQIVLDSIPGCSLGLSRVFDFSLIAEGMKLLTGVPFDQNALEQAADRILALERLFNLREGVRRQDDTLPKRLMREALPDGPSKGYRLSAEDLNIMLSDYYGEMGWDTETGIPLKATLAELDLSDIVGEM